jgi:hypothetical protein
MGLPGRLAAGGCLLALLPLLPLLALAPACGDVNANDQPFAGMVVYQDPAGAFALRLLEPPWLPPLSFDGATAFVVPPSDATITTDPRVVLSEALYTLEVMSVPGAPGALAAGLAAAVAADMPTEGSLETASGATGAEVAWKESATLFHRNAFLSAPSTATFQLLFTAKKSIADDAMIAQMIASFEPR